MLKLIDGKLYREETGYFEVLNARPCDFAYDQPLYIIVEDRVFMMVDSVARNLSGRIITVADSPRKVRSLYQFVATKGFNYELKQVFAIGATFMVEQHCYTAEDHRHIYNSTPKAYPEYFITPSGMMLYNGALYERI